MEGLEGLEGCYCAGILKSFPKKPAIDFYAEYIYAGGGKKLVSTSNYPQPSTFKNSASTETLDRYTAKTAANNILSTETGT